MSNVSIARILGAGNETLSVATPKNITSIVTLYQVIRDLINES